MSINLYVKCIGTNVIIHTVAVSHPSARKVERVVRGMLINMNRDEFYIDDSEADDLE